jgi:hypothetical protein
MSVPLNATTATDHMLGTTIDYQIDASAEISRVEPGAEITAVTWNTLTGITAAAATPEIDGAVVRRRISGGTAGARHTLVATLTLSSSEIIIVRGLLRVVAR